MRIRFLVSWPRRKGAGFQGSALTSRTNGRLAKYRQQTSVGKMLSVPIRGKQRDHTNALWPGAVMRSNAQPRWREYQPSESAQVEQLRRQRPEFVETSFHSSLR